MTLQLNNSSFIPLFSILLFIFKILVLCTSSAANNETSNGSLEEERLMDYLYKKLPKYTPPFDMQDKKVFNKLDIYQIIDVNEKDGLLVMNMWSYMYYYSPSAVWNSTEYGGIDTIKVPGKTFWSPDIVPLDAIRMTYEGFNQQVIQSNGLVVAWSSMITVQLSCNFDLTKFPYDTQYCPVKIGPWILDNHIYHAGLEGDQNSSYLPLQGFDGDDQWDLLTPVEASVTTIEKNDRYYDQITMHIRLKRLARFYEIVLIFPNILLYVMSSMVFWLPVDSGEKISLATTALLAEIVTFQVITDILPATSHPFPAMLYFICVVAMHIALNTLMSIAVINIHSRSKARAPRIIHKVIGSRMLMHLVFLPTYEVEPPTENFPLEKPVPPIREDSANRTPAISENLRETSVGKRKDFLLEKPEIQTVPKAESVIGDYSENTPWKHFAYFVDRIMFYLHMIVMTIVLTYFLR
ncbi:neuronal acetylcholine receptor subunit beta-3-like [Convolutriloba macropyga]|uniref:neuronal acetylcholine receptor subunit beta-3-like n=1 Tax=Convolutriloba macropyga TaxID=536237 RepID=UPI003F5253E4